MTGHPSVPPPPPSLPDPGSTAVPAAGSGTRRLALLLGFAAAAAVLVAAVIVVVVLSVTSSGTGDQFDAASEEFHTQLGDVRERIDTSLAGNVSPFGIGEAQQSLQEAAGLCRDYQETLREIDFPERALDERDRVIEVVEAYHLVAVNAAASFTPAAALEIVALWDEADPELHSAEESLRAALA